jgi:hypothetical protein
MAIGQQAEGEVSCVDFRINTNAGATNKNSGYHQVRHLQSATGPIDLTPFGSMTVTPTSRTPLLSMDAREKAQRGPMLYSGIDFGNVNPDAYEKGRYINARGAGLISAKIDLMSITATGVRLLNRINVVARNESANSEVDTAWSGIYTVTSISYRIDTTNYCEVIEGYRDGTNAPER